jgi:hypothetical protein
LGNYACGAAVFCAVGWVSLGGQLWWPVGNTVRRCHIRGPWQLCMGQLFSECMGNRLVADWPVREIEGGLLTCVTICSPPVSAPLRPVNGGFGRAVGVRARGVR